MDDMSRQYVHEGYITCDVFQCERPPVWQENSGRLLCEEHMPDTDDHEEPDDG